MSRFLRVAAALVVAGVAAVAGGAGAEAAGPSARGTRLIGGDERYGPAARQVVTVMRPAGIYSNRRTAIFIHGGAWTGGSRAAWDAEARAWAANGWITINMEYRRAAFDGRPGDGPELAQDVGDVYRKFAPLDLTGQFVLVGDSAGGQLATTVGSQFGKGNVAGIVAWSPVASPKALAERAGDPGRTTAQRELGLKAEEFWGLNYDGWSAHRYIRTGSAPPMFITGGTRERYIDWADQGYSLCTTPGFTGVCAPVESNLHGINLWRTPEGAKRRAQARQWAEHIT